MADNGTHQCGYKGSNQHQLQHQQQQQSTHKRHPRPAEAGSVNQQSISIRRGLIHDQLHLVNVQGSCYSLLGLLLLN
jgi:hypothetical protein